MFLWSLIFSLFVFFSPSCSFSLFPSLPPPHYLTTSLCVCVTCFPSFSPSPSTLSFPSFLYSPLSSTTLAHTICCLHYHSSLSCWYIDTTWYATTLLPFVCMPYPLPFPFFFSASQLSYLPCPIPSFSSFAQIFFSSVRLFLLLFLS